MQITDRDKSLLAFMGLKSGIMLHISTLVISSVSLLFSVVYKHNTLGHIEIKTNCQKGPGKRRHIVASWCFLGAQTRGTQNEYCVSMLRKLGNICCGHKMFQGKIRNIFWVCVRNGCCARWQTGKHLCRQHCVRNNVSSFARALTKISHLDSLWNRDWGALGIALFQGPEGTEYPAGLGDTSANSLFWNADLHGLFRFKKCRYQNAVPRLYRSSSTS